MIFKSYTDMYKDFSELPVVIFGLEGSAKEAVFLIKNINDNCNRTIFKFIGFIQSDGEFGLPTSVTPIACKDSEFYFFTKQYKKVGAILPFGNQNIANKILHNVLKQCNNVVFPNLIHSSLVLYDHQVSLGIGNCLHANSFLSSNVSLGDFNFIHVGCSIGHDSHLGNFNSLMPHVTISGNVKIGDFNVFGTNSSMKQNISIGDNCFVSMGSIVVESLQDNSNVSGNFATDHRLNLKEYQQKKMKG